LSLELINCWRCGIAVDIEVYKKRVQRKIPDPDRCADCFDTDKAMKNTWTWVHPVLRKIVCIPHKGDVDDEFRPLNKAGRLYMPGERICGMKDCVKRTHQVKYANKLVADPIETILALAEAQQYEKTPLVKGN